MTEPPKTEALLATVRTALRQGQRAMNELVWTHATLDPEAALDAIASELEQAWKDYEVQREYADEQYRKALAAEAELETLRRRNTKLEGDIDVSIQTGKLLVEQREAAEAELGRLQSDLDSEAGRELERVRAERDEIRSQMHYSGRLKMWHRCDKAEARLDRAVEALREIGRLYHGEPVTYREIARAALAEIEESGE